MEVLQVQKLNFSYPNEEKKALSDVSFAVEQGSFTVLCGASGCGKTTLLRLLKPALAPFGEKSGTILYQETALEELSERVLCSEIGFVGQNPEDQIVTDKVWHELAFGLENLGIDSAAIKLRIGDMASFFGIQNWYQMETAQLSGGQKQLLNLASVMVMGPKVLLFDEPTSQLDPVAAAEFLSTVQRLNRELGITIVMAEHRLEEVFAYADQVIVMEDGHILSSKTADEAAKVMLPSDLCYGLPVSTRLWAELSGEGAIPFSVKEGRAVLEAVHGRSKEREMDIYTINANRMRAAQSDEKLPAICLKHVYFTYDKAKEDVLRDLNLTVGCGEIYSILGGNGTGKTTALMVMAGLQRHYAGTIEIDGKNIKKYKGNSLYRGMIGVLPQNPKQMFFTQSVREDFEGLLQQHEVKKEEWETAIAKVCSATDTAELLSRHPYDLSGGELQRCAVAKLLLAEPKILLLDEPTKGMDPWRKILFIRMMRRLADGGKTIVLVTHDVELAAELSDRCGLFFDGGILSEGAPRDFFSENQFYTTAASRISRGILKKAVLYQDIISQFKEKGKAHVESE